MGKERDRRGDETGERVTGEGQVGREGREGRLGERREGSPEGRREGEGKAGNIAPTVISKSRRLCIRRFLNEMRSTYLLIRKAREGKAGIKGKYRERFI